MIVSKSVTGHPLFYHRGRIPGEPVQPDDASLICCDFQGWGRLNTWSNPEPDAKAHLCMDLGKTSTWAHLTFSLRAVSALLLSQLWLKSRLTGFQRNQVSGTSGDDTFKGPMKNASMVSCKRKVQDCWKSELLTSVKCCVSRRGEFNEPDVQEPLPNTVFRGSWVLHLLLSVLRTENSWVGSLASHPPLWL